MSSEVWVVHVDGRLALPPTLLGRRWGGGRDASPASPPVTSEGSAAKSRSHAGPPNTSGRTGHGLCAEASREDTGVASGTGVVLDGSCSSVPVLEQTFRNLEHSSLDGLDSALDFDNSFSRLRKHLLGSDHPGSGLILNLLDLETGSTDDGAHEIMRNQESDRGECADGGWRKGRVGKGGLEQQSSDFGIGARDSLDLARNREHPVLDALHDFGNTGLDTGSVSDVGNGRTGFTDDDTGLLGRDERSDGQGVLLGMTGVESGILGGLGRGFCEVKHIRVREGRRAHDQLGTQPA